MNLRTENETFADQSAMRMAMRYATLLMTTAIMLATPALADEKPLPVAVLNKRINVKWTKFRAEK